MNFFCRLFLILFWAVVFFTPAAARAFTIGPVKFFITIDPGAAGQLAVNVKNDEAIKKIFNLSIIGLRQDENGRPVFMSDIDEAEKWTRPEMPEMTLAAGAEGKAVFNINVPREAAPKAHYLGLAVEEKSIGSAGSVGLTPKAIAIVILQVAGEAREKINIEKWQPSAGNFWDSRRVFNLQFFNAGNIDAPVSAQVRIKNFFGREAASQNLELGNNLLSESRRFIKQEIFLPKMWPGWYEARLQMTYGRTDQKLSANARILYFPKWIILLAAAVIILCIFFKLRKRKNTTPPKL